MGLMARQEFLAKLDCKVRRDYREFLAQMEPLGFKARSERKVQQEAMAQMELLEIRVLSAHKVSSQGKPDSWEAQSL